MGGSPIRRGSWRWARAASGRGPRIPGRPKTRLKSPALLSRITFVVNINDDPRTPQQVTAPSSSLSSTHFPDWQRNIRHLAIDGRLPRLSLRRLRHPQGHLPGASQATGRRFAKCTLFTLYHLRRDRFADVWDLTNFGSILKQIS
ncbi:hypothetical protein ACRE_056890 [Hapsidospora chrysogenum ATCC 11550]|uniref:Uncharacterized protein n=1 Tax=Hapsidospora chrysogenum (strain ATCC 11550 / CBS 779.69 / DSM 880 / IAM 14645 / JCM 23072 / IMI 49137) TaxID=857340 RepID=A0A086T2H4_HAPC1|nr:hypothetical protein ACRE_056890 [Hapsidospora chrysogenum ATCC 11550]